MAKVLGKKIVVFGPDNAGKTTLAMDICSTLDYSYSHSPGPVPVEQMAKYIEDMFSLDKNIIFDRFPVVEEITCGTVLRGINKFDVMKEKAEMFLANVDLFIYCNPDMSVIENWQEREQMEGVKENIGALRKAYDDLALEFGEAGYPLMYYDWTKGAEEIENVKERIKSL